jgi:superfamily II DNA or RNA helicase
MEVDDRVQDVRNRIKVGTIIGGPELVAGRTLWRVRWDDRSVSRVPEDYLARHRERRDLWDLLRDNAFGGIEDFVRNYTHRKLLNPVDDTLYTLHASKTKLLPHQFKPLVRFLESIHRRYLIADEVGLGKTIEAGIILSELRARERLGGVLIYCPNHLRDKWKLEMLRRFDERFDVIASRQDWHNRVVRAAEDVGTGSFRFIVGHKTLASRRIWESLSEQVPAFDLVIVDEAHHFKNTATYSRRILGELSDAANQLLLLTATPLQTASDNLLSLLRLIDYQAFESRDLFFERLQANTHLVRAERFLRTIGPNAESVTLPVYQAFHELAQLSPRQLRLFGIEEEDRRGRLMRSLAEIAANGDQPDMAAVADVVEDVRQENLLAPYVTRTRKVEVQDTCLRVVECVRPDLTGPEQRFYETTVEWIRSEIRRRHGEGSVLFLSRNIERRLASSLPAFARYLRRYAKNPSGRLLSAPPLEVIRASQELNYDSKADRLLNLLDWLRREKPEAKILVFASFHGTLRYLSNVLERAGWVHETIHGLVPLSPTDPEKNERGKRVERFLGDPGCRILLSSNVGGEGLDLQRASIVINYDLPWNPAVVEQRIGRVDRFGQTEALVHVMNFVLPETVEDYIFGRLFDRLRLFEMTIGDFAEVLGNIVTELSTDFLRAEFNEEDLAARIHDAEWRIQNERKNLEQLLEREHELVAFDDDFGDHLRRLENQGQTIRPHDLYEVVEGALQAHFPRSWIRPAQDAARGSKVEDEQGSSVYELHIDESLFVTLQQQLQSKESAAFWSIIRRVNEGSTILVTFDGEVAEDHREQLELITSRHPLLRLLVGRHGDASSFHKLSGIRIAPGVMEVVGAGGGLLVLFNSRFRIGSQERRYLRPVYVEGDRLIADDTARRLLRLALDSGRTSRPTSPPDGGVLCDMLDRAQEAAVHEMDRVVERLLRQEEKRLRPRVAEARERYKRRIDRARSRLADLERSDQADQEDVPRRIKRARQYVRRLENELERKVAELGQLPDPETHVNAEAAAWIEVGS